DRLLVTNRSRERFEQQRDGCEPLLPVNDEERRLARHTVEALLDVHDGADEVRGHGTALARPDDVIPQLPTLPLRPAIRALIDRDDELRRFLQEAEELRFSRFHGVALGDLRASSRASILRDEHPKEKATIDDYGLG